MVLETKSIDPRRMARYTATALRLNIPVRVYLENGLKGQKYCTKCLRWKTRRSFREYESTKTKFSGICNPCAGFKRRPAQVEGKFWGPATVAAKRIGITPEEYVRRRNQGERWCSSHHAWFDARDIIASPRYMGGSIQRCRPCQKDLKKKKRG